MLASLLLLPRRRRTGVRKLLAALAALLLLWMARPAAAAFADAGGVDDEIAAVQDLYRRGAIEPALARLRGVLARLDALRRLDARGAALADEGLALALDHVAQGETRRGRQILEAVALLDPDRGLDPRIYGPRVLGLFAEARRRAGASPAVARSAAFGSLSVSAAAWVEVTVDGGPPEETPVFLPRLAVGRHAVRVSRSGFETQHFDVVVEEGETSRLHVVLERQ